MQRLVIFLLHPVRGGADEGAILLLRGLRPHAERLHVVVAGALGPDGQARLAQSADAVQLSQTPGVATGAFREAIDAIGPRRLARYEELVLVDDSSFGPVAADEGQDGLARLFERMDARPVDLWALTDHAALRPDPASFHGELPARLQADWLAFRGGVLQSAAWAQYWEQLPRIITREEAIRHHEVRLREHFLRAGFRIEAAFPAASFGVADPRRQAPLALLRAGDPLVARSLFEDDPVELDHHAVDAPEVLRAMQSGGFDPAVAVRSLAASAPPRTLAAAVGSVRALQPPVTGLGARPEGGDVVVAGGLRIRRVDGGLWPRLAEQPYRVLEDVDLIVSRGAYPVLGAVPPAQPGVRAITAGGGQGGPALGAQDAGPDGEHERPERLADAAALRAARDAAAALLGDPSPLAWAFADNPWLGAIVPLSPHVGTEVLGHGWLGRQDAVRELAARLGVTGPLDEYGPAAPYSAVAVYRAQALAPLARVLRGQGGWLRLSSTVHGGPVEVERLLDLLASRAVASAGYVTVEAGTEQQLATSLAHLQAKFAEVAGMLPAGAREPIQYLRARRRGAFSPEAIGETLVRRAPKFAQSLRAVLGRLRG